MSVEEALEAAWREERAKVLATLIRLAGDFDLAEEAVQDAFVAAAERWPAGGVPTKTGAWLLTAARNRALDLLRRGARWQEKRARLTRELEDAPERLATEPKPTEPQPADVADDRLRLIFTCCHPALAPEARVALTLHTLGGLSTEEIARAFLVPVPTLAQRLVRAKRKIRDARIPYRIPETGELPARLDAVLSVVYLIFNEGYAATRGEHYLRLDLAEEALRLARLLCELVPDASSARALLGLMTLHHARREARIAGDGSIVLLPEQDRARWKREEITQGLALVEEALRSGGAGRFGIESAIAALHAEAAGPAQTDWQQILALYDVLLARYPSPSAAVARIVALAEVRGPGPALDAIDAIAAQASLATYHLLPATRSDLLRRLGRHEEARQELRRAILLAPHQVEKRLLEARLKDLVSGS